MANQSTPAGISRDDDSGLKDAPQHHSDCSQRDHHCQLVIVAGWHSVDAGCTCPICSCLQSSRVLLANIRDFCSD